MNHFPADYKFVRCNRLNGSVQTFQEGPINTIKFGIPPKAHADEAAGLRQPGILLRPLTLDAHSVTMKYTSTRGNAPQINFEQAATCGLAPDGGLYVPVKWPTFSLDEMQALIGCSYCDVAFAVLQKFSGDSVPSDALRQVVKDAYSNFDHPDIAPLRTIRPGLHMLELFHGPTLSFKDYALQFLGRFMDWSLQRHGNNLTVVGATSGDTGSAAISAVSGCKSIDLYMLHPFERVSPMQRRQMTTNQDANIFNYAIDGTFDDCQAIVKTIFGDPEVQRNFALGAVNSINWGRISAQVAYYFYAALQLGAPNSKVSFAVPTGNFGNVFAAWTATKMGLPIDQMMVCSNANDILTRFFETGVMKKYGVKQTVTPSMDIEVSSNFERYLFEIFARDGAQVANLMQDLKLTGQFKVDDDRLEAARSHFVAGRVNDVETCETIADHYAATGDIIDPHSAVALTAANRLAHRDDTPMVVVATAHPAKFPETIERTLGVQVPMPQQLRDIAELPERYRRISNDPDELKTLMLAS